MSYKPPFARRRVLIRNIAENRPPTEPPTPAQQEEEPERSRGAAGKYLSDDPDTPEFNEAYVSGKPVRSKFNKQMNKTDLLAVASEMGVEGLSMENTKDDILGVLEEASK